MIGLKILRKFFQPMRSKTKTSRLSWLLMPLHLTVFGYLTKKNLDLSLSKLGTVTTENNAYLCKVSSVIVQFVIIVFIVVVFSFEKPSTKKYVVFQMSRYFQSKTESLLIHVFFATMTKANQQTRRVLEPSPMSIIYFFLKQHCT